MKRRNQSAKEPNNVDIFVGERMRTARKLAGLSQTQLSVMVGTSFQQLQKYEKGINRVSAGRLYDIAGALERPIPWFFPPDPHAQADQLPPVLTSREGRRFIAAGQKMAKRKNFSTLVAFLETTASSKK